MEINMIAAIDLNRAIGVAGKTPWHLPDDLKNFKALTSGQTVLMGRKTFESIGVPLPSRRNLVLSRDPSWTTSGVEILRRIGELEDLSIDGPVWVIGGGEIYTLMLPRAKRIEITKVHTRVDNADAWFPCLVPGMFSLEKSLKHSADARHKYSFEFQTLIRNLNFENRAFWNDVSINSVKP